MDLLIELGLAIGLASLLLALTPLYYMFISLGMLLGVLLLLAGVLGTLIVCMRQKLVMHSWPLMADEGIVTVVCLSCTRFFPPGHSLPSLPHSLPRSLRNPLVFLGGPLLLLRHQTTK